MLLLGCSLLGTFSSILVFIGLRKDQREFLVPYILLMSLDILIALLHFLHVVIFGNLKFEPLTGTLFTIDFFIFCLNVSSKEKKTFSRLTFEHDVSITILQMYCLICIVSQYQEYKNGQGLTTNHYIMVSRENQKRDSSISKGICEMRFFTISFLLLSSVIDRVMVFHITKHPKNHASFYINQRLVQWTMDTRISHSFRSRKRMEVQVSASSSRLIDLLGQQSIIDLESLMLCTNTVYST
jgi:hypothetical protein